MKCQWKGLKGVDGGGGIAANWNLLTSGRRNMGPGGKIVGQSAQKEDSTEKGERLAAVGRT